MVAQPLTKSLKLLLKMVRCDQVVCCLTTNIFLIDEAGDQRNEDTSERSIDEQQSDEFDVADMEPPGFEEEVMNCLRPLIHSALIHFMV